MAPPSGNDAYRDLFSKNCLRDAALQSLLRALGSHADQVRVIGGAVRNALRGARQGDLDVATIHLPNDVIARLEQVGFKTHPTGIDHGTVTAVLGDFTCEVTTLREDVETDGRHAKVRFGSDWQADADRRDFTMNALSVDRDGLLYDPVNGLKDCLSGHVRFIGDPARRIAEDHLRSLRFFRFSAHYGDGAPDAAGLAAIGAARAGLAILSPERIHAELLKWLSAPSARQLQRTVISALECGVFPLGGLPKQAVETLHLCQKPDALLRLTFLFSNDQTCLLSQLATLRFSKAEQERLKSIFGALRSLSEGQSPLHAAYHWGAAHAADALYLQRLRLPQAPAEELDMPDDPKQWHVPVFPVGGADLKALGFQSGPDLGRALKALEAAWLASDFQLNRADLIALAQKQKEA